MPFNRERTQREASPAGDALAGTSDQRAGAGELPAEHTPAARRRARTGQSPYRRRRRDPEELARIRADVELPEPTAQQRRQFERNAAANRRFGHLPGHVRLPESAVEAEAAAIRRQVEELTAEHIRLSALPRRNRTTEQRQALARAERELARLRRLSDGLGVGEAVTAPPPAAVEVEPGQLVIAAFAPAAALDDDAPGAIPTWGVNDEVLIADKWSPDGSPRPALVLAEDPARPRVVQVKYLHSKTAAWVARTRVLGRASSMADTDSAGTAPRQPELPLWSAGR